MKSYNVLRAVPDTYEVFDKYQQIYKYSWSMLTYLTNLTLALENINCTGNNSFTLIPNLMLCWCQILWEGGASDSLMFFFVFQKTLILFEKLSDRSTISVVQSMLHFELATQRLWFPLLSTNDTETNSSLCEA